ncbi:MAG: 50S ribosomal protein L29 [Thermonemataceae bacterium]
MKAQELRALSIEELREKLLAEQEAYSKIKLAHAISEIENPMKIRANRRLIARIQTVIKAKEKELGEK